ncbi:MAG: methylated-DNA--[protein]-cysteine S-methyltransferase [Oscillospiraceae bacterium]|nr:methylated-DNA--[protein]-cysteine S-methyltransferase [Oscillospiraceae bacterium]
MFQAYYKTLLGTVIIASSGEAVTAVKFQGTMPINGKHSADTLTDMASVQLQEYLAGERCRFDLPLCPAGTPFQKSVWTALLSIPYGETRSYGQIAQMIGNPKASRAVGMANNKNPICIIIPCHRVIGANSKLTGYAGGLGIKEALLDLEKNLGAGTEVSSDIGQGG